jgi:hypothetical protein
MGFKSFWKHVIMGYEKDDPELQAARAKHGIEVGDDDEEEKKKEREYDAWEEIRNMRSNFFFGSWATRKFRVIGEDKVKRELEALEKKRQEEEERKRREGEEL